MIKGIEGSGFLACLAGLKPTFAWDARGGNSISGAGLSGAGRIDATLNDADSITTTEPFTVWDAGNERFKQVTPDANPREVLGSVGDFSDGYLQQRWPSAWDATTLGFAVVSPTAAGQLTQESGVYPDILEGCTHGDITVVDTDADASNDSIIEGSFPKSSTYKRVFQILVKSEDEEDAQGNVFVGMNDTSGTRTVSTDTWCRKLPGSRGWWACGFIIAASSGTAYASVSFAKSTGRWFVAAPMIFSTWSTMENVIRAPIPVESGPTTFRRGQWWLQSDSSELTLRPTGWLAMSIVLPDRSVSNGHKDYALSANYKFLGLLELVCDAYRLRVNMSDTSDYLTVALSNVTPDYIAYLDLDMSWEDFAGIGLVTTWEISNGHLYATLFVNGNKMDSTYDPALWYPGDLLPGQLFIGKASTATSGECWISRVAMGQQPIHRSVARALSKRMYDLARGKR